MQLTITETVTTVGWKEGCSNAPKDVVDFAQKSSEDGIPTAFGKIDGRDEGWVVIQTNQKPYIAYRYEKKS